MDFPFISYPLGKDTPAFGNGDGIRIQALKQMDSGDSCNTSYWNLPNHLGTHLDFPKHFIQNGNHATDYNAGFFVFNHSWMIHLGEVKPGEIISSEHLRGFFIPNEIELLIIKTGFCKNRDKAVYWHNNPGFSPQLADFLRDTFPNLRVLGFDSISLTSFAHRQTGRKAHKRFLEGNRPLLLLEDMDLIKVSGNSRFKQITIAPLRVSKTDASPCTVLALVDNV
ncbi:cyclase family protein [Desulfobacter sp.]|uniref:cyclase family protein n=1 Tax=Desulfobacter sp. TaxID=2294 RepID=UPI003D0B3174